MCRISGPQASSLEVNFLAPLRQSVSRRNDANRQIYNSLGVPFVRRPPQASWRRLLAGALRPDRFRRPQSAGRVKSAAPISGGTGATRRKSALTSSCRFLSMARSHLLARSSIVAANYLNGRAASFPIVPSIVPTRAAMRQLAMDCPTPSATEGATKLLREFDLNKPAEPK